MRPAGVNGFFVGNTLFDKLWQAHEVTTLSERQSLLYVDRIFLHERTGSVALNGLLEKQRSVRRREHAFCTMDHIVDTLLGRGDDTLMPSGRDFIVEPDTRLTKPAFNYLT